MRPNGPGSTISTPARPTGWPSDGLADGGERWGARLAIFLGSEGVEFSGLYAAHEGGPFVLIEDQDRS